MLIAKEKRKSNIAEYILYMKQIQDLLRALDLDLEKIKVNLVERFDQSADVKKEIFDWYQNLALMIVKERIRESGQLQIITNITNQLNEFHFQLMKSKKDPGYNQIYLDTLPVIIDFRNKSQNKEQNDISVCIDALYGVMMLRLQKKEVTKGTGEAVAQISKLLAHLSLRFKEFEAGDLMIN